MNQMLVLSDKDFKAAIKKMLKKSIINSLETNKKIRNSQPRHKSLKKKNKMEIIELSNTIIEIKKTLSG